MPKGRPNAFERARAASLKIRLSFWAALEKSLKKNKVKAKLSRPENYLLSDENATVGAVGLERRTLTFFDKKGKPFEEWVLARPLEHGLASLPLGLIEEHADSIIQQAEKASRAANLQAVLDAVEGWTEEDSLAIAREALGPNAAADELKDFAAGIQFPEELLGGEDQASAFFDENISTVRIEECEDGSSKIADAPPEAPGAQPLGDSEWDHYTPEELEDRGGPESDWSYAYRVKRLCEAIRAEPEHSITLGLQLGAILREWEIWREFGEFLTAGVETFRRQSERASSKKELPWMKHVREDFEAGRITGSIADYARTIVKMRSLKPPSLERVKNFVSELRAKAKG